MYALMKGMVEATLVKIMDEQPTMTELKENDLRLFTLVSASKLLKSQVAMIEGPLRKRGDRMDDGVRAKQTLTCDAILNDLAKVEAAMRKEKAA